MDTDPTFAELQFREIDGDYEPYDVYIDSQPSVTVLVERPPGEEEPDDFAEQVHDQLESAIGTGLDVTVELVDTQRSG